MGNALVVGEDALVFAADSLSMAVQRAPVDTTSLPQLTVPRLLSEAPTTKAVTVSFPTYPTFCKIVSSVGSRLCCLSSCATAAQNRWHQ